MGTISCPGCGARFPDINGPVHRYMGSSSGCWAAFGAILAREYSDPAFSATHRLSVDAYAVQHPGAESRQSIHSVGLHLIRLCLFLEQGLSADRANEAILAAGRQKHRLIWLRPPEDRGRITVADVASAKNSAEHQARVLAWAQSAWQAWAQHHTTIRKLLPGLPHVGNPTTPEKHIR